MNGIHAGLAGDIYNTIDAQIAFTAWRRPDTVGLIGIPHVECGTVGFREYRNRVNTALLAGTQHTNSNFTSVGDQHLFKHLADPLPSRDGRGEHVQSQ